MASSKAVSRKRRWDQQSGGYDYDFVGSIPSKYTCSVCTKVLRDAHLTECCGQHFCASCLTHWLGTRQRKTCPHCRQKNFQHMVNKAIIREVNELKIHCTNHREGCEWVGQLAELKSHLDSEKGCGYVEVTCSNKKCRGRMKRADLHNHKEKTCYYRNFMCEFCGQQDTYWTITRHHYSECPEYPLDCPNKCGVTGIRRRAMPGHHSDCQLEPLKCPFKDAGCTEKIARQDMEKHMTDNLQEHLLNGYLSLQRSNKRIKRDLRDTKQELADTKEELEDTQQELEDTKNELEGTKKELEDTKEELEDIQKQAEDTKEELEDTQRKLEDTKEELKDAKQDFDDAQEQLQDAVQGFRKGLRDIKQVYCKRITLK